MTLKDEAVFGLVIARFYHAPVGTVAPDDLADLDEAWVDFGHTSLDSILSMSSEGGDTTTLGTLQAPSLKQSTSARTESWAFNLQQWDPDSLRFYFGSNAVLSNGAGQKWLHVPDVPTATEKAFLIVMSDGARNLGWHAEKTEIKRGDDLDFSDTSSLASLPLSITPLNRAGAPSKYSLAPIVTV